MKISQCPWEICANMWPHHWQPFFLPSNQNFPCFGLCWLPLYPLGHSSEKCLLCLLATLPSGHCGEQYFPVYDKLEVFALGSGHFPSITALPFRVPGHIPVWHCLQTCWERSLFCHYSTSTNPWGSSLGLTAHWLDFVPPITTPWDQFSSPFSSHLMPVSIPCLSI